MQRAILSSLPEHMPTCAKRSAALPPPHACLASLAPNDLLLHAAPESELLFSRAHLQAGPSTEFATLHRASSDSSPTPLLRTEARSLLRPRPSTDADAVFLVPATPRGVELLAQELCISHIRLRCPLLCFTGDAPPGWGPRSGGCGTSPSQTCSCCCC
eukprot:scaffold83631_cov21-Tisochrysis_lutea.AAC.4